ncbi:MAG: glycosyltransferase [Planctomycetia bacterium]|nr:glycosyltransferase [Planctomycetia bacterium]
MHILIGTDYYYPSVGGQQIVLKEIAERLVKLGHKVTIATSKMPNRKVSKYNGVNIKEFNINGSYVHGIQGKVSDYQNFVLSNKFDVIMIKAAQGWTIDALIPILNKIKTRKVFIPCGFSALYNPYYSEYYNIMPNVLRQFDHLIFYASDYRDINFAREHNITNFSIIPNGASEVEFSVPKESDFRERLNIKADSFILLTVGTFTGGKGQYELAKAFQIASFTRPTTLILNGNQPSIIPKLKTNVLIKQFLKMGPRSMLKRLYQGLLYTFGLIKKQPKHDWMDIAKEVNSEKSNKTIIITDLQRQDVIQAFLNSDLFVFASNIEYSPLVLFESAAAGLPFITVPVGNAKEIIEWTKGGVLCPASIDNNGRTIVNPQILAKEIMKLANAPEKRKKLGKEGKINWSNKLTWGKITLEYENVLKGIN